LYSSFRALSGGGPRGIAPEIAPEFWDFRSRHGHTFERHQPFHYLLNHLHYMASHTIPSPTHLHIIASPAYYITYYCASSTFFTRHFPYL
jgi:hypothetical protein